MAQRLEEALIFTLQITLTPQLVHTPTSVTSTAHLQVILMLVQKSEPSWLEVTDFGQTKLKFFTCVSLCFWKLFGVKQDQVCL